MPASYTIDPALRTVFSTLEGRLTDEDLLALVRRLQPDPDFHPHFSHVVDARGVTEMAATSQGLRSLALASPFADDARAAIVAVCDLVFGMARMYQIASESRGRTVQVFRDLHEALAWLGVPKAAQPAVAPAPRQAAARPAPPRLPFPDRTDDH